MSSKRTSPEAALIRSFAITRRNCEHILNMKTFSMHRRPPQLGKLQYGMQHYSGGEAVAAGETEIWVVCGFH
jgi:hypothetical protein